MAEHSFSVRRCSVLLLRPCRTRVEVKPRLLLDNPREPSTPFNKDTLNYRGLNIYDLRYIPQ